MYENGQGVPQDDAKAAKWFRKAAEQGQGHGEESDLKLIELLENHKNEMLDIDELDKNEKILHGCLWLIFWLHLSPQLAPTETFDLVGDIEVDEDKIEQISALSDIDEILFEAKNIAENMGETLFLKDLRLIIFVLAMKEVIYMMCPLEEGDENYEEIMENHVSSVNFNAEGRIESIHGGLSMAHTLAPIEFDVVEYFGNLFSEFAGNFASTLEA